MSLLELLQRGDVDAFNLARSQRDRPDLFAADLAEARMSGADLSSANLAKADLTEADLSDSTLLRADLSGADGTGADLGGALAIKVKLREAYFDGCRLDDADLSHSDLTEAVLASSSGARVRLVGASLRRTDARGARWPGANLADARMHKVDLTGADLTEADLTAAVATEAALAGAILARVSAQRASFAEADLTGAKLPGADLSDANLSKANLTDADLRGADLTRANLAGAIFTGCDLREARLAGAVIEPGALSGARVEGADLTGHDPEMVGVAAADIASLGAYGAPVVEGAALVVAEPAVARRGQSVALLWLNPDSDTASTVRWGIVGPGGARDGVLSLPAEGVVARAIVPTTVGFLLLIIVERPGGHQLVQVLLGDDGRVEATAAKDLRYAPSVVPVVAWGAGGILLTGLARRGPAVVVQRLGADGPEIVATLPVPTATGFWSVHSPVVATRGGVVIGVDGDKLRDPARTPAGFPGRAARVVSVGSDLLAVWFEASDDPGEPGWLRMSTLGGRGEPTVRTLHRPDRVSGLDIVAGPDGLLVAWVEPQDLLVATAWTIALPRGRAREIEAAGDAVTEVRWARGLPTEAPALVVMTLDRGAVVLDGVVEIGRVGSAAD